MKGASPISSLFPFLIFFFFNDTATPEIYTLSLHDALPILARVFQQDAGAPAGRHRRGPPSPPAAPPQWTHGVGPGPGGGGPRRVFLSALCCASPIGRWRRHSSGPPARSAKGSARERGHRCAGSLPSNLSRRSPTIILSRRSPTIFS